MLVAVCVSELDSDAEGVGGAEPVLEGDRSRVRVAVALTGLGVRLDVVEADAVLVPELEAVSLAEDVIVDDTERLTVAVPDRDFETVAVAENDVETVAVADSDVDTVAVAL